MTDEELAALWERLKAKERDMIRAGMFYRHYRGAEVQLLGLHLREEDLAPAVLYSHGGTFFSRRLDDWEAEVIADGDTVRRFAPVR